MMFQFFLLWTIISLGIQVQRLSSEVAFVAEEARDLRHYGLGQQTQPQQQQQHATPRNDEQAVANDAIVNQSTETSVDKLVSFTGEDSVKSQRETSADDKEASADLARKLDSALFESESKTTSSDSIDPQADLDELKHSAPFPSPAKNPVSTQVSTSLGRVVFGSSGWDQWATHPT